MLILASRTQCPSACTALRPCDLTSPSENKAKVIACPPCRARPNYSQPSGVMVCWRFGFSTQTKQWSKRWSLDELLWLRRAKTSSSCHYPMPHPGSPCCSIDWLRWLPLREGRTKRQTRYKGGVPGQLNPGLRRQSHGSENKSMWEPPADFRHLD